MGEIKISHIEDTQKGLQEETNKNAILENELNSLFYQNSVFSNLTSESQKFITSIKKVKAKANTKLIQYVNENTTSHELKPKEFYLYSFNDLKLNLNLNSQLLQSDQFLYIDKNLSDFEFIEDSLFIIVEKTILFSVLNENQDNYIFLAIEKYVYLGNLVKSLLDHSLKQEFCEQIIKQSLQVEFLEKNKKIFVQPLKMYYCVAGLLLGRKEYNNTIYIGNDQFVLTDAFSKLSPELNYLASKKNSEILVIDILFSELLLNRLSDIISQTQLDLFKFIKPAFVKKANLEIAFLNLDQSKNDLSQYDYCKSKLYEFNQEKNKEISYSRRSIYSLALFLNSKMNQSILDDEQFEIQFSYNQISEKLENYGFVCKKKNYHVDCELSPECKYLLILNEKLYIVLSPKDQGLICYEANSHFVFLTHQSLALFDQILFLEVRLNLNEENFEDLNKIAPDKFEYYGAKFFNQFFKSKSTEAFNLLIYKFFQTVFVLLVPSFIYGLINQAVYQKNTKMMTSFVVGLFIFLTFQAVSMTLYSYYSNQLVMYFKLSRIGSFMRIFLNQSTNTQSFGHQIPGFILTRISLLEFTLTAVKYKLYELPVYFLLLIFYFIYIAQYSVLASFLLLGIFTGSLAVIYSMRKKGGFTELNTAQLKQDLFELYVESVSHLKTFFILNHQNQQILNLNKIYRKLVVGSAEYSNGLSSINFMGLALFKAGTLIILYFVLVELIQHRSSPAELFGVSIYLSYMISPFQSFSAYFTNYNTSGLMSLPVQLIKSENTEIIKNTQSFKFSSYTLFEKVSFRYNDRSSYVIQDASFKINKGEFIVVIGRCGSGKSTLGKLISKKIDSQFGRILIDGKDQRLLDEYSISQNFSYVPQISQIFDGTILSNLLPQNFNSTFESVLESSLKTGLDKVVKDLFDGDYFTRIHENSTLLSPSQITMINVTRALLENSKVLVLDEVTAQMDPFSEEIFIRNIIHQRQDQTIVFLTSKMNIAKLADKILVLKNGRIIEEGDHSKLLNLGGEYSELFRSQIGAA